MPQVVRVHLTGALQPWVTAKDVILELLRRLTVRGGTGKIFEYGGPGLRSLIATQRMTIANMGAELGLTTSIFPSDDVTRSFLTRLGRGDDWRLMATLVDIRGALYGKVPTPADELWINDSDVLVVPKAPIKVFNDYVNLGMTQGLYSVAPFRAFGSFAMLSTLSTASSVVPAAGS